VARKFCKNRYITRNTSSTASTSVFYHFFDRQLDEGRGVIRHHGFHPRRKLLFHLSDFGFDRFGRIERVRARGQLHRHACCRLAVVARQHIVILATEFDACYIAQIHGGTTAGGFQQDRAELLRRLQTALGRHRGIQLLARQRRRATEFTGRDFGILRLDSRRHIGRRELVAVQLGRIEPDPHCILRAERSHITHPFYPAQAIDHIGGHVVAQIGLRHLAVFRHEAQYHQEVHGSLGYHQPLLGNDGWQQRRSQLQLVLHLHLRDIGIGTALEGQRDADAARAITGRGHVAQAVDAFHFLFNHLRHRVFHGFGGSARIRTGNRNRRRCNARVLRNRQAGNGNCPRQHDDDGHHPRKDRPVYKKS